MARYHKKIINVLDFTFIFQFLTLCAQFGEVCLYVSILANLWHHISLQSYVWVINLPLTVSLIIIDNLFWGVKPQLLFAPNITSVFVF